MGKTYKIKLEDKAAFLNRLEKVGIPVDTFEIKDNQLGGYFTITFVNPEENDNVQTILKQSTKIDQITEIIRKIVKQELKK